jgi:hypothetical protein
MGLVERLGVADRVIPGGVGHLRPDQVDTRVGEHPTALDVRLPVDVGRAVGVDPGDDDGVLGLAGVEGGLDA